MDDDELKTLVDGLINSAAQFIDGELGPERAKATEYYMGKPFGNEEPGRSQFISTEVRDGVQAVLPSMLKPIFGSETAVEFVPRNAQAVDAAAQATDYVQMVFAEDNPGFLQTHAWMKDALVRKIGVAKWWWDESTEVEQHKVENVDESQIELLAAEDDLEITRIEQTGKNPAQPPTPENPQGAPESPLFTVEFKRTIKDGRARWDVIPPEEFLYNREARQDPRQAIALWHRTRKTRGELIALGIDPKVIEEHGGDDPAITASLEAQARQFDGVVGATGEDEEGGKANEKHLYCEGFARIDYDGDGIAEVRKICALGPGHYPVVNDPASVDDINFAVFVPDPEPHTMTGLSWADRLMDLQRYKSMLMRGLSDSLAMSIFPRVVYQAGNANLADILNTAVGAPIRASGDPNTAVREFAHSFLGKETMPVIDLIDSINERRTGQNRGVAQLDADALQSSTPSAVAAAVSASQAQQELLVRIFAETALKPLFKGLLRLLVTHQPRPRIVRLRNQWVAVDPRSWNIDMDVTVNVALGAGLVEEKVATLIQISEKQMEIMTQLGTTNPIVGLKELRDTLAEITELRGKKNSSKYWKPVTQQQLDQLAAQAAQNPPPPSPEQILAEAQVKATMMKTEADIRTNDMKAQRELAAKQADMALRYQQMKLDDQRERERAQRDDDRERDKMTLEFQTKMEQLQMEHQLNIHQAKVRRDAELTRATLAAGPNEGSTTPEDVEGYQPPKRRRRRVTVDRGDGRPPLQATIEDHDDPEDDYLSSGE